MDGSTTKIGIMNSRDSLGSQIVYVEPWGEDYTLRPGEELQIVAAGQGPPPWFNVVESDGATSVYIEGGCKDFAVYQSGQRLKCGHNREA